MATTDMPSPMAQGWADPIQPGSGEAQKDADGTTNPNLHRRLSSDPVYHDYKLGVFGVNSYRVYNTDERDEESDETEVP